MKTLEPLRAYEGVPSIRDPRARIEEIRRRSKSFREQLLQQKPVQGLRSFNIISFPFLTDAAFWRASFARGQALVRAGSLRPPAVLVDYRMYLVRHESGGKRRVLLLDPLVVREPERIPVTKFFYGNLEVHASLGEQLRGAGVRPEEVDTVVIDHLHLQDLRPLVGSKGVESIFPNATFLLQRAEWEYAERPHPVDRMFLYEGGVDGVENDRLVLLDGDVWIDEGLALIRTPGHTPGHQTLVVRVPDGIYTIGENGLSLDNYYPEQSEIDGVARFARDASQEVLPIANTFTSPQAQYESMILEKTLADPYCTLTTGAITNRRKLRRGLFRSLAAPGVKRLTPMVSVGALR